MTMSIFPGFAPVNAPTAPVAQPLAPQQAFTQAPAPIAQAPQGGAFAQPAPVFQGFNPAHLAGVELGTNRLTSFETGTHKFQVDRTLVEIDKNPERQGWTYFIIEATVVESTSVPVGSKRKYMQRFNGFEPAKELGKIASAICAIAGIDAKTAIKDPQFNVLLNACSVEHDLGQGVPPNPLKGRTGVVTVTESQPYMAKRGKRQGQMVTSTNYVFASA